MKKDLLKLIDDIPKIETKFRTIVPSGGLMMPPGDFIYDDPDFIEWKAAVEYELQQIYDRTKDKYIWNIINATGVIHEFRGNNFNDRENFNRLKSHLRVIQKNIDRYFLKDEVKDVEESTMLKSKIFISHSSTDLKYVEPFVELLADIGMTNENLFCSSVPDYSIPLNEDIYDYLALLFREYKLYVIFVLSDNYYNSPACMNEMGAAWVLKNEYTSILLPEFEYRELKGAVNPNKIGMKLDDDDELLKKRLGELKNIVSENFGISVPDMRWEKKRNDFIKTIKNL